MRVLVLALCATCLVVSRPSGAQEVEAYDAVATWYALPGKLMAGGGLFQSDTVVIAARDRERHPLASCVRLVNPEKSIVVVSHIQDRMPAKSNRHVLLPEYRAVETMTRGGTKIVIKKTVVKTKANFDLSPGAVRALGLNPLQGVFKIRVESCTTATKKVAGSLRGAFSFYVFCDLILCSARVW